MEEWKSGMMEEWNNGKMERWKNGMMEEWNLIKLVKSCLLATDHWLLPTANWSLPTQSSCLTPYKINSYRIKFD